jgi:ubiquinone biosynthesis monooxygenase Coq7
MNTSTPFKRHYSFIDEVINVLDNSLRTLSGTPAHTGRPVPTAAISALESDNALSDQSKKNSAAYMRVNHTGEICAQALYHGQALVTRSLELKALYWQSAIEEGDHLYWCQERLNQLNSHTSYFNPLWYTGSLLLGMIAGLTGDKTSLGFLAETEHQVEAHLNQHLDLIPKEDIASRAIIMAMREDEITHAQTAINNGAATLPWGIPTLMQQCAKIMTTVSFYI